MPIQRLFVVLVTTYCSYWLGNFNSQGRFMDAEGFFYVYVNMNEHNTNGVIEQPAE